VKSAQFFASSPGTNGCSARRILAGPAKIDWESLLRAFEGDKDLQEVEGSAVQAEPIDFSSGFLERFARKFAALAATGATERTHTGEENPALMRIDKTHRLLYFLMLANDYRATGRPGDARRQGKEPD
jgi:hypothetical protein